MVTRLTDITGGGSRADPSKPGLIRKKILICEDDSSLLNIYNFVFKKEDVDILTLPDGRELFSTAKRQVPSLIILDLMMPEKDGLTALKELNSDPVTASIPVIVVSAVVQPEMVSQAKKLGAKEFLEKPFTPSVMHELVRKYIA